MTNIVGPFPWDWETGKLENRHWLGAIGFPAFDTTNLYDQPDASIHVMCPISGKEMKSYSEMRRRWDGVMVSKEHWDPRPRNYRRRPILREHVRTTRAPGALTFLDDAEGRLSGQGKKIIDTSGPVSAPPEPEAIRLTYFDGITEDTLTYFDGTTETWLTYFEG